MKMTHLNEKFQYYQKQFIEASLSAGVTVPLDFFDDKSNRLFNFMMTQTGQCGPKYVLSVIESFPESIHLIRCSLSLLIITIQLLRKKLPENGKLSTPYLLNTPKLQSNNQPINIFSNKQHINGNNGNNKDRNNSNSNVSNHVISNNSNTNNNINTDTTTQWKQQVTAALAVWAAESLDKIANDSALNICIKVLKYTQAEDIQVNYYYNLLYFIF